MSNALLRSLSMSKYESLLARFFPGASGFGLYCKEASLMWSSTQKSDACGTVLPSDWKNVDQGLSRRADSKGNVEYRSRISLPNNQMIGWLHVAYESKQGIPLQSSPSLLQKAFSDAVHILASELALQLECDLLAIELTERYEELNLVYSTDDQVEYFEEGQEALVRLVRNCADYLDVGMSVLICRDRNLEINDINRKDAPVNPAALMELLRTTVYDRVESQVEPIVLNERDDVARRRVLSGRDDNLIAQPIVDNHGTAIGILAVAARENLHTFSNGDRNLIEVMAKKASRIIHTHHDSLTGLMNRSGFESAMMSALSECRAKNLEHCLLYVDIDQLHVVNDLMGYQEGDKIIRRVAKVLSQSLRDSDALARLGANAFGILLDKCTINDAIAIAEKISGSVEDLDVIADNRQLNVSVSIGIAPVYPDSDGIVGLLGSAEIACKSAKENSRGAVKVFERDNAILLRRSEEAGWSALIQEALRDDLFTLYCQPVVPLIDKNRAAHYELLIRLINENGDVVSPAEFMPAAERFQLMPLIDRWVIRTALKTLGQQWHAVEADQPVFCINLSGQSLTHNGFLAFVLDEIRESGIPPRCICFEVTETSAIGNIDEATRFMGALKDLGCRFSLDDFGAGLSSFGYLKMLPVDYLKIDGSFVREMTSDTVSYSMVEAIFGIGRTMGLSVVGEFVENEETANALREIGVDFGQGYGLGKPEPIQKTIDRLAIGANTVAV